MSWLSRSKAVLPSLDRIKDSPAREWYLDETSLQFVPIYLAGRLRTFDLRSGTRSPAIAFRVTLVLNCDSEEVLMSVAIEEGQINSGLLKPFM